MKLTIEGREFKLSANGRFLKKFCTEFNENLTVVLYNAIQNRDLLAVAKLMYCALDEESVGELKFDEWLESFKSPLFIIPVMDKVIDFLIQDTTPTVTAKDSDNSKKKKIAE